MTLDELRRLVRNERKRRAMTQSDLAHVAGHTQKWLSDFERGKSDPPAAILLKLLNTLGLQVVVTRADGLEASGGPDEAAFLKMPREEAGRRRAAGSSASPTTENATGGAGEIELDVDEGV